MVLEVRSLNAAIEPWPQYFHEVPVIDGGMGMAHLAALFAIY